MAAELDFPQTPKGTLAELWSAVLALLPQLARRLVVRRDYAIATTETPIAHGLPFAPQVGLAIPQANVAVWESRRPDARCVYLIAASATTANVVIIP
jgi:hypothetical protein